MAKAELTQCLKFKRLMRRLPECSRPLLIGHLDLLWQTAWAGKVVAFERPEDAEVAAEWGGEPGRFATVLLDEKWLVQTELGLEIKDWWEHAPEFVKRRKDMLQIALVRGYPMPDQWLRDRGLTRSTGAPQAPARPPEGNQRKESGEPTVNRRGTTKVPTDPKTQPNHDQDQGKDTQGLEGRGVGEGGKGARTAETPPADAGGSDELHLTPPGGEPPPGRKGARPKGKAAPNPDVKRLLDVAVAACEKHRGFKPVIRGGPEAQAMAMLLKGRTFEQAARLVGEFYREPPDWNLEQGCLGLEHIPAAATKILARASPNGANGRRDATGAPLPEHRETVEDTVDVDSDGVRRLVKIKRDAGTGAELGRTWGRAVNAEGGADGQEQRHATG
jgi:hypothetical protein